jgi:transcriptional regulator with XRE-family HTH domain
MLLPYQEGIPDMGRASRRRYVPSRLGEKFRRIRAALDLTQDIMLERLELPSEITQSNISAYERGTKEPPIFIIMRYAEVANVWIDVLVNDSLELPDIIPSTRKHEGIKRKQKPRL